MTAGAIAAVALVAVGGVGVGIGAYTFVYAEGAAYLTNDPAACANCHVMREHYSGWVASSHHGAAVCNDCHTPPDAVGKYATKALNGFWHSFAFTTGRFPEPIRINARNRAVTESACRHCHADVVAQIDAGAHAGVAPLACTGCHDSVGHLE
ncbi:MAG TPA: cytochrome c nitrite reductase small subunit [Candidatus Tectomicrobia bacterium]|nr:cytochrome c nitrite reductase small subunit [Candidatus Tectomicrobia bacterium]